MTVPLFVRIQNHLINMSACEGAWLEDDVITFSYNQETLEITFETNTEAAVAFENLQATLASKNIFLGQARTIR